MKETALDRVERALNLIPFISSNPGLSITQIAERFGSTPTQISKDLTLLHMCGLPGYTHLELLDIDYEDPEFIQVTDAQVLDHPRSLTQLESLTLVLGLQLLAELAKDPQERESIIALQSRLSSMIGDEVKNSITITDGLLETPIVKEIQVAISQSRVITFTYDSASSDTINSRRVFPLEILFKDGIGYLQAANPETLEIRTFRVDRIIEMTVGEVDAEIHSRLSAPTHSEIEIEIEMGEDGLFFLEKHNEIVTSYQEAAGQFHITLAVSSPDWIKRVIASWPSRIKVVKPLDLAEVIEEIARQTLDNYS